MINYNIKNNELQRRDYMAAKLPTLNTIEKVLEHELDFNFSINEKKINSTDEFNTLLKEPFYNKNKQIFYRGERINDPKRTLTPTLLRHKDEIFKNGELIINIDYEYLLQFYRSQGAYLDFYRYIFGTASKYRMFEICSFSQHYLDMSPFIDFTKSLFVALSFALKQKDFYENDIVIYAVEIDDKEHYTNDIVTAECWLHDYKVTLLNSPEKVARNNKGILGKAAVIESLEAIEARSKNTSPTAKFIDIPTNDLIKFQQGVFMLLTDYTMFYNSYLTKSIRENFHITKYVISKNICPDLLNIIAKEAPWYQYECLLDIKKAAAKATGTDNHYRILKERLNQL